MMTGRSRQLWLFSGLLLGAWAGPIPPSAAEDDPNRTALARELATPLLTVIKRDYGDVDPGDLRAALQFHLRTLGYFLAFPDGRNRSNYRKAIRDFQAAHAERSDGRLTLGQTYALLGEVRRLAPTGISAPNRAAPLTPCAYDARTGRSPKISAAISRPSRPADVTRAY
ncbi:MAG: peptidoglycan-binding protein [Alphaproteobacteria bacterium]|nr:peptidoglycan-binding protein [Alphaproteobacteria bacterium]